MKNLKTVAIAAFLSLTTIAVTAQSKKVNAEKSEISWVGKKVTGQHEGTVKILAGELTWKGKSLVGGNFTIDMNSIAVTDLKAGQGKEKLEGHLKSEDFFGVEKFATSKLVFTNVAAKSANVYAVTADLTIKGITNPVKFDLTLTKSGATTSFDIDRTKFDIKYKSKNFFDSLGDNVIYDDFNISVQLVF